MWPLIVVVGFRRGISECRNGKVEGLVWNRERKRKVCGSASCGLLLLF